jgi:hypothetical protein
MAAVDVVNDYFAALARRDVDATAGFWAPDGEEHIVAQVDAFGPSGVREYFSSALEDEGGGVTLFELDALDPAVCWPGHLGPLTGDVRAQLERAAAT